LPERNGKPFDHNGPGITSGLRAAVAAGPGVGNLEREAIMSATTKEATAKQKAGDGRDANGRFAPSNPGGPGNPYARKVAELRKAMAEFVSVDDLKHIVFAIKMKAETGNVAAAKLLFQYVLGKPTQPVDPDRLSVDEWQKLQEQALPPREMEEVMNTVPAQMACNLTKIAWPCAVETNFGGPLRELLKARDEQDAKTAGGKPAGRQAGAPTPNGGNGIVPVPEPIANGPNGGFPDWWDQAMREVMAETRQAERDHGRRGKKRRKYAARR
jgi:hypothetical protein